MKFFNRFTRIGFVVLSVLLFLSAGDVMAQERLSVTSDIANMRSGPGTKSDILWKAEKYYPVIVVEKEGNWYLVRDYEHNPAGWVHKSLLGKVACVAVKKAKCNVRSKPSTKGAIVFVAEKGVPLKVLDRRKDWVKVKHADGDVGWIHKKLVW